MSAENCSKEVEETDSLEIRSGLLSRILIMIMNFFVLDWFQEET
jgi:hypothetical protein